jgi:hypothetical protein
MSPTSESSRRFSRLKRRTKSCEDGPPSRPRRVASPIPCIQRSDSLCLDNIPKLRKNDTRRSRKETVLQHDAVVKQLHNSCSTNLTDATSLQQSWESFSSSLEFSPTDSPPRSPRRKLSKGQDSYKSIMTSLVALDEVSQEFSNCSSSSLD